MRQLIRARRRVEEALHPVERVLPVGAAPRETLAGAAEKPYLDE